MGGIFLQVKKLSINATNGQSLCKVYTQYPEIFKKLIQLLAQHKKSGLSGQQAKT